MTVDTVHRYGDSPLSRTVFEPVTRADTDSWISVVADVVKFATVIAETEFVPAALRGSAPATAAAMLYGREVGLPPMTALSSTHVVDGRPAISAEAQRALVLAAGHEIAFDVQTGAECTMRGRRRGSDTWTSVTWNLAMARAAGLLGRTSWQRYPRAMLAARATAELCRLIFPDVIHGFAAVEELDDGEAGGSPQTAATGRDDQSPTDKPVRRRGRRVASGKGASRPADPPGTRPGGDPDPTLPLPGEPGYLDPSSGAALTSAHAPGDDPAATRSGGDNASAAVSRATAADAPTDAAPSQGEGDTGSAGMPPPTADPVAAPGENPQDPGAASRETVVGGDDYRPDDPPPVAPRLISRAQQRMLFAICSTLGRDDRDSRLAAVSTIVGRPLDTTNELSADEASDVIETLGRVTSGTDLDALLAGIREAEPS